MEIETTNYVELFSKAKPGYRVCSCCLKEKPVTMFYSDGTDRNGNKRYRRDCKQCYKSARDKANEAKMLKGTGRYYD